MPLIRVEMFEGRSEQEKRELAQALTKAFVDTCGGKPEAVSVIMRDVDKQDWAVGGELCSDLFPNKK